MKKSNHDLDPKEIIERYHRKSQDSPKMCKKCSKGEMIDSGVRTSASVNYTVWKCNSCENEDLKFLGLANDIQDSL